MKIDPQKIQALSKAVAGIGKGPISSPKEKKAYPVFYNQAAEPETPLSLVSKLNTVIGLIDPNTIKGYASPEAIVSLVLKELKTGKVRLEAKDILNLPQTNPKKLDMNDLRWHGSGAGLSEVAHDSTLTGDGTSGSPLSVVSSGSGITSINADTTAAQLLTVGTSGTDFAIADNGTGTHAFNLPTASAVNRGALSSTDWSTFNSKMANPMTTGGDIIYGGAAGVPTRLANGNATQVLQSNGTTLAPSWITIPTQVPALTQNQIGVGDASNLLSSSANLTYTPAGTLGVVGAIIVDGQSQRIIGEARNVTAGTGGVGLIIDAGGGSPGFNNVAGGDLLLKGGTSTGTASSNVRIFTSTAAGNTPADNLPTEKVTIDGAGTMTVVGGVVAASYNKVLITAPSNTATLTLANAKTVTINNSLTFAGTDATTMTFPGTSQTVAGLTSTQTLTNKRLTRRLVTVNAPGATPTTNTDNVDIQNFTGLGAAITSMTTNLSGTPVDGDKVEFRFTDDGTPRGITWGASFAATTVALPSTTVTSTMLRVGFEWNGSLWQCLATC